MVDHAQKSRMPVSSVTGSQQNQTPVPQPEMGTSPEVLPQGAGTRHIQQSHILNLQRKIGNRAVQRMLANATRQPAGKKGGFIQRLLAVPDINNPTQAEMYVSKTWLDTKYDDRKETGRDVITNEDHADLKSQLLSNLAEVMGSDFAFTGIREIEPANKQTLWGALYGTKQHTKLTTATKKTELQKDKTRVDGLLELLATDLQNMNQVTTLDYIQEAQDLSALDKKLMMSPNLLVMADSDLEGGFDITKVCALIALFKAEGEAEVKKKLNISKKDSDAEYYEAMHTYYRTGNNTIEYDEPITHPSLYANWGYSMIFAGNSAYEDLPTVLSKPLETGKRYIFDITGHSVYVTMKKKMSPGDSIPKLQVPTYFKFESDRANFRLGETSAGHSVLNIFEKG